MVTEETLERTLAALPLLRFGVVGDLFLDRYLELDAALTEKSLETGLDAYQVVRVRACPGAAGTIINNLEALGVSRIVPIAVIGDDGEGFELRGALGRMAAVDCGAIISSPARRTPTYAKPLLCEANKPPRELNRLDVKNRTPLPSDLEDQVLAALDSWWPRIDAWIVQDQVSEEDCGVVTARVRQRLGELAARDTDKLVLADSRERIGLFTSMWLKPNHAECSRATGQVDVLAGASMLAQRCGRPVFCTRGEKALVIADPRQEKTTLFTVPAYPVAGPTDCVGAGDSSSAAIACALAAGINLPQAGAFGNLAASITIQQLGVTGTATPAQLRERWRQIQGAKEAGPAADGGL